LRETDRLAGILGEELEGDAIVADYYLLWKRYATELEAAIRLAECDLSAGEISARLRICAETIGSPRGAPGSVI